MKPSFTKLSLLALPVFALTACQDFEPFDEAEVHATMAAREFAKNFEARYGKIDPNHTWGFVNLLPSVNVMCIPTRAEGSTGTINLNRNQWAQVQTTGEGTKFITEAIADDVQIPGYPNFDGKYYTSNGGDQKLSYKDDNGYNNDHQPIGDITEYEIQYVSAWFRTHEITDPTKYREQLHLSDFFIQTVSADHDQLSYGQLSNDPIGKNGTNINDASEALAAGLTNVTLSSGTTSQQLEYPLDYLCFKPMGANATVDQTWTHVNNFNAGNQNHNPEENLNNNQNRTIMYITSSGTEDFACRASFSTSPSTNPSDIDFLYDWVLVHLTWMEEGIQRDGYYLAFDYAASKTECTVVGDDYYSNWIVKITPAHFSEEYSDSKRIMCEDLGNTFDFDFNDVVFDVRYEEGENTEAIISLQAAGGTLPIYVGVNPQSRAVNSKEYEAHRMLGGNVSSPINVGKASRKVAIYRIPVSSTNPDDIPVFVEYSPGDVRSIASANRGNLSGYAPGPYNPQKEIDSNTAPQKFAVPITVQWMQECEFIEKGYPAFPKWVANENSNKLWYNAIGNSSLIYEYKKLTDHYDYNPDTYVDDSTGEGSNDEFTFNWFSNNPNGGTFTIPASYFANANTKIVITFKGNFQFQFAMPAGENIPYINDNKGVLTIDDSVAISSLKAGTHNTFSINYCDQPSNVKTNMFEIVCQ